MKAAGTLLFALAAATIGTACAGSEQAVLTFHGEPRRSGNFLAPALSFERARGLHLDPEFDAKIAGHIYAQPLYWRAPGADAGMLFAATEENNVYALNAKTGKEIRSLALGKPVPLPALPPLRQYRSSRHHRHAGNRSGGRGDLS